MPTSFFEGEWIRERYSGRLMLVVQERYTEGLAVLWYSNGKIVLSLIDDTDCVKVPYETVYADLEDAFRLVSAPIMVCCEESDAALQECARKVVAAAKVRYFLHKR